MHKLEVLEVLIEFGIDVNADQQFHWFIWTDEGTTKNAQPLIERVLEAGFDVDSVDEEDMTVLMVAISKKTSNQDIVETLLAHDASVHLQDIRGMTALHRACIQRHTAITIKLIAHGASIDILDLEGKTPLDYCDTKKKRELCEKERKKYLLRITNA